MQRQAAGCARFTRYRAVMPLISGSMANKHIDALNRLARDRRLVDPGQIEELAPGGHPTGGFDDRPSLAVGFVEPIEPGIGVRLHQTSIAGQVLLGMLAER